MDEKSKQDIKITYTSNIYEDTSILAKNLNNFLKRYSFRFGFPSKLFFNVSNLFNPYSKDDEGKPKPEIIVWKPANYDVGFCPRKGIRIKGVSIFKKGFLEPKESKEEEFSNLEELILENGDKSLILRNNKNKTCKIYLKYTSKSQ